MSDLESDQGVGGEAQDKSPTTLQGQFLIALPGLVNDFFATTVTYMIQHNEQGAFGLVINKPMDLSMGDLFGKAGFKGLEKNPLPVLDGGPVRRDSVFFLHESGYEYQHTQPVSDDICLTTSVDLVRSLSSGHSPGRLLTIMGYAGWDDGQLERELADNVWLVSPANSEIIFDAPYEKRAEQAAALLGIDLNLISSHAGHG